MSAFAVQADRPAVMVDSRLPGESCPAAGRPGQPADPPPLPCLSHPVRSRSRMPEARSAESAIAKDLSAFELRQTNGARQRHESRRTHDGSDGRGLAVDLDAGGRGRLALNSRCGFAATATGASLHPADVSRRPQRREQVSQVQERAVAAQQTRNTAAPPPTTTSGRRNPQCPRQGAPLLPLRAVAPGERFHEPPLYCARAHLPVKPPRARAVRCSIAVRDPTAICTTRSARRGSRPPPALPAPISVPRAMSTMASCSDLAAHARLPCASQRRPILAAWSGIGRSDQYGSTRRPLWTRPSLFPGCQLDGEQRPATVQSRPEWFPTAQPTTAAASA